MIDNIYCKVKHNNNQNVFSIINDAVTYSYQKSPAVLRPGFSGNGILKNDQYLGYDMMICGFVPWRYAELLYGLNGNTLPGLVNIHKKLWKDPLFSMGKSTISMVSLNSKLLVC